MNVIHDLWRVIKERVCDNHNLNHSDYYPGSHQDNCIKNRTAKIFILEIILHEHRKKHANLFNALSQKEALHHIIFIKTNWKLADIRNLSLADSLIAIHEELSIEKLPNEAKLFIDTICLPEIPIDFDSPLEEDWNPKENAISLARMN